jgi:hypothetical protein
LNVRLSALSGSGPIEIGNSMNSPGLIEFPASAVQVIWETTSSVLLPSSSTSGVSRCRLVTV